VSTNLVLDRCVDRHKLLCDTYGQAAFQSALVLGEPYAMVLFQPSAPLGPFFNLNLTSITIARVVIK